MRLSLRSAVAGHHRVVLVAGMLVLHPGCASSRQAACPATTTGSAPGGARSGLPRVSSAPSPLGTSAIFASPRVEANDGTGVSGTWLWSCCDGADTWVGMLVLVETGATLRGSMLSDGDSHGSYIEGKTDGDRVQFSRRWYTAGVLHEQFYELVHDARAQRLVGTFTEPAHDTRRHEIRIERGFTPVPRRGAAPTPPEPGPSNDRQISNGRNAEDAKRAWERKNRDRPCDCKLVCYCGGAAPGPEQALESSRCGDQCRCPLCAPIP